MRSPLIHHLILAGSLFISIGSVQAQGLSARILLQDQSVLDGNLTPRKAGTTQLQFMPRSTQSLRNLSTSEVEKIFFDLNAFPSVSIQTNFDTGDYDSVIEALKGRVIPYFQFVDLDTNSNELVKLFIQGLYRTENFAGVHAAGKEVAKYDVNGEMRRFADVYRALSFLEEGLVDEFAPFATYFDNIERKDPLAPALWMGQSKLAQIKERPQEAYEPLAKIITETPMQTRWSAEALYLSAVHHHTRTNLVVANQICNELKTVAPLTPWPEKAEDLQKEIRSQAKDLEITLVDFGEIRTSGPQADDAKIDYRERQRELKEQEIEFD